MELTYSGLADVVASEEVMVTRVERQTQLGRTLTVGYGEASNRLTSDVEVRGGFAGSPWCRVRDAVWDTGSMMSAIDEGLAREIGLTKVDESVVATMSGVVKASQYFVDIRLAEGMVVRSMRVNAVDLSGRPDGMRVLIGMDVISRGRLVVDSSGGATKMEFMLPGE